jgi:formate dehydrogenase accessory protein FdhE
MSGQRVSAPAPSRLLEGGDASTLERLAQAGRSEPGLRHLVPFWSALYRVLFAERARLAAAHGAFAWSLQRDRLLAGQPQLSRADLPLAAHALAACVQELARAWQRHDPASSLPAGEDWLARAEQALRDPTLAPGQRRELGFADTLAALSLVPYLEWAAAGIAPTLEGELEAWGRGLCPVCGGLPDLAILAGDPAARHLVCSRCSTPWPYARVGCPFCRDAGQQAYYADGDGTHRLYVCPRCRRYLKTVVAAGERRVDPWAERLLTMGMDLAALEAGYGPGQG